METIAKELKKWKSIAIASFLVSVIAVAAAFVILARSGSAQPAKPIATGGTETEAAGTDAAGDEAAGAEATGSETETENTENASQGINADEMLSYWMENAEARKQLVSYMEEITREGSSDYIPVEDRIAVFDFDGTLFCETDPNYFDYTLLLYRVMEDPDYMNQASGFEKHVAEKIKDQNENGTKYEELPMEHGQAVASAFKGMSPEEFNDYIQEFKKLPMPNYEGMTRGDGFYEPMLQIVKYLQAYDFTVYVVSGTDRFICRGIMDNSPLDLPNKQIIGSDESVVATSQNGVNGLDYTFTDGDRLVLGGDFIIKNLKMNKVIVINQEIGQQPVLSFGNSTGDAAMANYVISGNPYKSLAFMLCCDDLERENGDTAKADKMYELCEENNWIPISMKNDWTTIYAEGVSYLGKQTSETEEPAAEQVEGQTEEAADGQTEEAVDEQGEEPTDGQAGENVLDNAA